MYKCLVSGLLTAIAVTAAHAEPLVLSFKADNFVGGAPGDAPPVEAITGALIYDSGPDFEPLVSLLAIDLSIGDKQYTLQDVTFENFFGGFSVGGTLLGAGDLAGNSDDFRLVWSTFTGNPLEFAYAINSNANVWTTQSFPEYNTTPAVPEPGVVGLALAGLGVAIGLRRRDRHLNVGGAKHVTACS